MSPLVRLRRLTGALGLAALLGAAMAPAVAAEHIAPNEAFESFVNENNGVMSPATILVGCTGPIQPGQTGNPLPNQDVRVQHVVADPPFSGPFGFTGSAANRIVAVIQAPTATGPAVFGRIVLPEFDNAPIPTTLMLPCSGRGLVRFVPMPPSASAVAARVPVRFVPQP